MQKSKRHRRNPRWGNKRMHMLPGIQVSSYLWRADGILKKGLDGTKQRNDWYALEHNLLFCHIKRQYLFGLLDTWVERPRYHGMGWSKCYLNAPFRNKIWFEAGPEHGPEKTDKVMVMIMYLYGLKSSGSDWRTIFTETLSNMDFVPTVDDTEFYRRWERKPNGEDYY